MERGRRFTKADYCRSGIPAIHYADVYTRFHTATKSVCSHVRKEIADTLRYANPGDLIVACTGETRQDIAKAIVWEGTDRVAVHDDCTIIRLADWILPRYISYCFQTSSFTRQKMLASTKGKTVRIAPGRLSAIRIPVPDRETQKIVVDILDRFDVLTTSLSDGLPAEIAVRRKQYEYYRDRLLIFPHKETAA